MGLNHNVDDVQIPKGKKVILHPGHYTTFPSDSDRPIAIHVVLVSVANPRPYGELFHDRDHQDDGQYVFLRTILAVAALNCSRN